MPTLLETLRGETAPPEAGSARVSRGEVRWSEAGMSWPDEHGDVIELGEGALGALQLSRSAQSEVPSVWGALLGRAAPDQHWLHAELRSSRARLRLKARVADPATLEGLPWLESEGEVLSEAELTSLLRCARALGADLARWDEDATQRPEGSREPEHVRHPTRPPAWILPNILGTLGMAYGAIVGHYEAWLGVIIPVLLLFGLRRLGSVKRVDLDLDAGRIVRWRGPRVRLIPTEVTPFPEARALALVRPAEETSKGTLTLVTVDERGDDQHHALSAHQPVEALEAEAERIRERHPELPLEQIIHLPLYGKRFGLTVAKIGLYGATIFAGVLIAIAPANKPHELVRISHEGLSARVLGELTRSFQVVPATFGGAEVLAVTPSGATVAMIDAHEALSVWDLEREERTHRVTDETHAELSEHILTHVVALDDDTFTLLTRANCSATCEQFLFEVDTSGAEATLTPRPWPAPPLRSGRGVVHTPLCVTEGRLYYVDAERHLHGLDELRPSSPAGAKRIERAGRRHTAFSADCQSLITEQGVYHNLVTGERRHKKMTEAAREHFPRLNDPDDLHAVDISPSGRRLAAIYTFESESLLVVGTALPDEDFDFISQPLPLRGRNFFVPPDSVVRFLDDTHVAVAQSIRPGPFDPPTETASLTLYRLPEGTRGEIEPARTYVGHRDLITALDFGWLDGERVLLSASHDLTLRAWALP